MRPLKFNFDNENDLCIWKSSGAESIAIDYCDVPLFQGKLQELVSGDTDHLFLNRQKWGVLKIEKIDDYYRIYGKVLEYDCDREDLKRLENYLSMCIKKGAPIYTNDIPPEMESSKIIVVANDRDRPAAESLMDKIDKKYHIITELWSSENFIKKESNTNYGAFISVGGFTYNPITERYLDTVDILEQTDEIHVGTKLSRAIVFGYYETESCLKAVKLFIQNYLDGFIKTNFPDIEDRKKVYWTKTDKDEVEASVKPPAKQDQPADTPKQPDPQSEVKSSQNDIKPIEKKPNRVEEDKEEYKSKSKYEKEFYELGTNSWKIKYYDEENVFDEYNGLVFMHHIFSNPGKNVKFDELYYLIYPPEKDNVLDDVDNEKETEIEEQDEIDIESSNDNVRKQYKKSSPLSQAGMENPRTKDVITKEISDYKKGMETLKSLNNGFLKTINEQNEYLSQLKRELEDFKTIEKETRITRAGEKKKTVSEKLTAQENVSNKIKEIKNIEEKIKFKESKIVSNKDDIAKIKTKINQLAVELKNPTVETSVEFENVRTSIVNSIRFFKDKLEKAGFKEFIKYWDVYVKKYNGYTYNPMDNEPWKLVK